MVRVVIDPGHGGPKNPPKVDGSSWNNATGPTGLLEKTATLQVAKAAAAAFSGTGVQVILTRTTDVNLGIAARAKVAKDAKADAFVSIHFNGAPKDGPPAQGTETWIGNNPTTKSRKLATAVQTAVQGATGLKDRGVKVGGVSGVINNDRHHPQTAHCLVEISFIDRQPAEEARLREPAYVDRLGQAVCDGVMSYLVAAGLVSDQEIAVAGAERMRVEEPEDAASAYEMAGFHPEDGTASPGNPSGAYVRTSGPGGDVARPTNGGGYPNNVPFVADRRSDKPFSDLDGRSSVDDPAAMLRGFTESTVLEAEVGDWNTVQSALLQVLGESRRAVARIAVPEGNHVDYLGRPAPRGWNGTGFLVGDNILLTNHHVLNSPEVAGEAFAEFGYEVSRDDLLCGRKDVERPMKRFKLDPQRLFITSPANGSAFDYTFVWIDEAASKEFGIIPMERASFTVNKLDPVFIIHHPRGRPKEASLDDTEVLRVRSTVIHYAADTDYGSSGAPVFDSTGRLIALHHARNTDGRETLRDGRTTDVLNEGVKIAAIAIDLENRIKSRGSDAGMAQAVLACMTGSDTLTGFFGALGRDAQGKSNIEAVVDAYTGTEQDVDVGFWNIEWLANRYREKEKLEGAATVIADLNLDIWGLIEVSPPAVQALVGMLQSKYGERYECAFSEPDAPEAKQSTAVIWKPRSVTGGRVEWPKPIADWWKLDSRDDMPFEAVDGKIFDRYPGLFKFAVAGREGLAPFDFHLVPLHLKAMAEGSKRRRLASMLLARAIQKMIADGEDLDWIIGGDVNSDLASEDFAALRNAGLVPMSAADEAAGAFSYLKSPNSLIDNIFISPNVKPTVGSIDYFIVAAERSVDKYVKRVSDHRPVVMRVSLANRKGAEVVDAAELARLVNRITGHKNGAANPRRPKARPPRPPAPRPAARLARHH